MLPTKLPTKLLALTLPVTVNTVNVPTDVIFGCALADTVIATFEFVELVANVAVPAVATFKLATCVVLVTMKGAVPVATFDMNLLL